MDCAGQFQSSQIICLEHQNSYLYAEVIDVVQARQMCWGRPLMLAIWPPDSYKPADGLSQEVPLLYDLREGADLLLPSSLFRLALDTELIPLLTQLETLAKDKPVDAPIIAHRQLRSFVHQIWQAHPSNFKF